VPVKPLALRLMTQS